MVNVNWFKDSSKEDISLIGEKAVNLSELFNNKFPVPAGFCVTAEAYRKFLEHNNLHSKINEVLQNLDNFQSASEQIQALILSAEMPGEVSRDVIRSYENLNVDTSIMQASKEATKFIQSGREYPFVVVRSSSEGGLQESFLNIKGGNNIVETVKKCWASLFTPSALSYRAKNNISYYNSSIGVVIQKMVNSDKSGFVFTKNPKGGDEIIIEAGYGLGDAIVSGVVNTDRYVVNKTNLEVVSMEMANKSWMNTRDRYSGKLVRRELDNDTANNQCLSNEEISKLSALARRIETYYEKPQKVEYAIEGGRVHIVNSRVLEVEEPEEEPEKPVEEPKEPEIEESELAHVDFGDIKIQVPRNSRSVEKAINLLKMLEEELKR